MRAITIARREPQTQKLSMAQLVYTVKLKKQDVKNLGPHTLPSLLLLLLLLLAVVVVVVAAKGVTEGVERG